MAKKQKKGILDRIIDLRNKINKPIDKATNKINELDSKISKANRKSSYLANLLSGDEDTFNSTYEDIKEKLTSDYDSGESNKKLSKYDKFKKLEKQELLKGIEKLDSKYKTKIKLLNPNSKLDKATDDQLEMKKRLIKFINKCKESKIKKELILTVFKPMAPSDDGLLFDYILMFLIINSDKEKESSRIGFTLENLCNLDEFNTKNKISKSNALAFYDALKDLDSNRLNKFIEKRKKFKQYDFSELTERLRKID